LHFCTLSVVNETGGRLLQSIPDLSTPDLEMLLSPATTILSVGSFFRNSDQ
jgi:hypothetical protein